MQRWFPSVNYCGTELFLTSFNYMLIIFNSDRLLLITGSNRCFFSSL